MALHLGDYDVAGLGYRWSAADPAVDALQVELVALVEAQDAAGAPPVETFAAVAATIRQAAGLTAEAPQVPWAAERPRLTEAWFCCAEPTAGQLGALRPAMLAHA